MNKVNLYKYFIECPFDYVILRKSDIFPDYKVNADIDIVSNDKETVVAYTLNFAKTYDNFKFYPVQRPSGHFHIDIRNLDETLNLKLDFIFDVGVYGKVMFDKKMLEDVLEYKIMGSDNIWVPNIEHELLIRYLEYKENVSERPDKIKHLNYIKNYPNGEKIVADLVEKYKI